MEPVFISLLMAGLFVWFILADSEYAYLIGGLAVIALVVFGYPDHLAIIPQRIFSQFDVFSLMALPLFLLTAELMSRGGITSVLVHFGMALMGRSPGSLGNVNILTSVFFAGVSGSAIADAASLGRTLVPVMEAKGYSRNYAAAITAASSVIGPIIPPSIIMILYGGIMQTDIAALFAGGIIPGLLLAGVLIAANIAMAMHNDHPRGDHFRIGTASEAGFRALPALALPAIILGGIVFGLTTPTEAGAVAALAAYCVTFFYTRLSPTDVGHSLRETVSLTGAMFMLIAGTGLVSYLAALLQWPDQLSALVLSLGIGGQLYLALVCFALLLFGMVTGVRVGLFLLVPLIVPQAVASGVSEVHAGVVTCYALTLGLLTPPFGPALLAVSAATGVEYKQIVRSSFPFLVIQLLLLAVLIAVPSLSTFLPQILSLS